MKKNELEKVQKKISECYYHNKMPFFNKHYKVSYNKSIKYPVCEAKRHVCEHIPFYLWILHLDTAKVAYILVHVYSISLFSDSHGRCCRVKKTFCNDKKFYAVLL